MATCLAVSAVLPSTIHKTVLFFWCPSLQEKKNKVNVDLEPPLYILLSSQVMIIALDITKSTDLALPLTKPTEHSQVQLIWVPEHREIQGIEIPNQLDIHYQDVNWHVASQTELPSGP
jgi:hypothetical protein